MISYDKMNSLIMVMALGGGCRAVAKSFASNKATSLLTS